MKIFILSVLLLAHINVFATDDPKDILSKMAATLESHQSISYTAVTRMKYFSGDDTNRYTRKVFLAKEQDSVFGGKTWHSSNDDSYGFYDLRKIYNVNNKDKKATTYDPLKGEEWALAGQNLIDVVWNEFLKPGRTEGIVKNAVSVALLADTIFNEHSCYRLVILQPDEESFTDKKTEYYIGRKDFMPYFVHRSVLFQGNYEYREFTLLNYTFDKVLSSQFSANQIPSDYTLEAYIKKEVDMTLLDSGAIAPVITGKHYQNNLKEETLDYKEKVTVLDFWYMACYYCIQAIPEMERLREKYKDNPRVQIIGVNPYDADTKGIEKLPQFLEHNPIGYSFFLVDKQITDDFKVKVWPSFYVIDKSGKVAYSDFGFDPEKLYTNLSEKIEELLKQ